MKLKPEEKEQIVRLYSEGLRPKQIAERLAISAGKVSGTVTWAISEGKLQKHIPVKRPMHPNAINNLNKARRIEQLSDGFNGAPVQTETPTSTPEVNMNPAPVPAQVPPPAVPVGPQDSFSFKNAGPSGNFLSPGQAIKYMIERLVPPDGLLGTHTGILTPDEMGRIYGEGTYRVTKNEPGKLPVVAEQVVAPSYGKPRYPRVAGEQPSPFLSRRFGQQDDEGQSQRHPSDSRDRSLFEFARHSSGVGETVAAEAIRQLASLNQQSISQMDSLRKAGPDQYLQALFERQTAQAENTRKEEREREQARHMDEDRKWERRQEEETKRHERDLMRLKAEAESRAAIEREQRQTLLELEQKKLDLIREESRSRENILLAELTRSREEAKNNRERIELQLKEVQEKSEQRIAAVQASVEEDLEHGRDILKREYDLREKALSNEQDLKEQILKIRTEVMQTAGGDGISKLMEKVVGEISGTIKEVVELKKLEVITPEAQVAAINRGQADGNVVAPPPPSEKQTQSSMAGNGNGNGHGNGNGNGGAAPAREQEKAPSERGGQVNMDSIIVGMLKRPQFADIVKEWALHVKTGNAPTSFAHMYLELMRDPDDHEARKACTVFANFMTPRDWPAMFNVIGPHVAPDTLEIFETPEAEEFYEGFRAIVVSSIQDYFEQYMMEKKAAKDAAAAGRVNQAEVEQEVPSK